MSTPLERVELTQARDELLRMRAFLVLSGVLAVLGAVATFLVQGNVLLQALFLVGVLALVVVYLGFYLWTRDEERYNPLVAALVIAFCNVTGVAACLFYGMWSPAPMVLMLPIAFFGLMRSSGAALFAYLILAGAQAVGQLLVLSGILADPGALSVETLSPLNAWLYAGLVHLVYVVAFLFARASHRASTRVLEEAEQARQDWDRDRAVREEAERQLDEARGELSHGMLSGQTLSGWQLGRVLGRGGTGTVYAGVRGDSEGAVKVLTHATTQQRHLLRREAGVVRTLESPHIVRVLDVVNGEHAAIVMERLVGEDLGQRLRRVSTLTRTQVIVLVSQVGAALEVARGAAVVHRDIKPSNLFAVGADDETLWKVLDFGISKLQGYDATLTRGMVLGTPGYMAPEQARMEAVDHRADLFSLAAVTYRALTGAPPFSGRGRVWQLSLLYDQPRQPSDWAQIPREVDLLLALALAKRPEDRLESAQAFARHFEAAMHGRLEPSLRHRAEAVLARHPWGARRVPRGELG